MPKRKLEKNESVVPPTKGMWDRSPTAIPTKTGLPTARYHVKTNSWMLKMLYTYRKGERGIYKTVSGYMSEAAALADASNFRQHWELPYDNRRSSFEPNVNGSASILSDVDFTSPLSSNQLAGRMNCVEEKLFDNFKIGGNCESRAEFRQNHLSMYSEEENSYLQRFHRVCMRNADTAKRANSKCRSDAKQCKIIADTIARQEKILNAKQQKYEVLIGRLGSALHYGNISDFIIMSCPIRS